MAHSRAPSGGGLVSAHLPVQQTQEHAGEALHHRLHLPAGLGDPLLDLGFRGDTCPMGKQSAGALATDKNRTVTFNGVKNL
jgi:hypothetical protein